ncbi:hypothetical protein NQ314_012262 [Rhamnusium bicolor]|uniref:Uncharacterized protein n=1 Tax=Rhamnusium bicolor TaxID=1586634 RepID=A0AAV8XCH4_9CUCU|nr:hypothetical protein NQ314_012262 [Rhamnusium bicolor]
MESGYSLIPFGAYWTISNGTMDTL